MTPDPITLYERFLTRNPRGWHGHRFTVYGVDPPEGPEVRTLPGARMCSSGRDCAHWTCEKMTQPPERLKIWRARILRDARVSGCSDGFISALIPGMEDPGRLEWSYYRLLILYRGRRIFGQDWGKIID